MVDPLTGKVISGFVGVVLGKLGSKLYEELAQIYGVKSQFRKLEKTLSAINAVLQDAEVQQYNNNSINDWLANIKEVVYDIEDLLDLISTEELERKVDERVIGRLLTGRGLYFRYTLTQQVNEICGRLDEIAKIQSDFNLRGYQSAPVDNPAQQRETYSYIQESDVFGREQDKEWIVSRLVSSPTHKNEKFLVIPLIGMGGIGKTTLAKLVYNDARVKVVENFDLRLWTHVSYKFVLTTVIENIIQSFMTQKYSNLNLQASQNTIRSFFSQNFSNRNMQALQNMLHEILRDRTFLLVLDDVWVEDLLKWKELMELLAVGSRGAVIVTTREERIASPIESGTIEAYRVKDLPHDHCWSIFVKCAFKEHEEEAYPLLVQIGQSIIKKCKGVPLAVKTMGSLLRGKKDVDTWKKIERSELWTIAHGPNGILPALKLSFDHTPCNLRSCFAYCAIFGKGYPLRRNDLISVWMAQGLLQDQNWFEDGDKCFDQLLSRAFFQFPEYAVIEKHVMKVAGVLNWHNDWVNLAQGFKKNMIGEVDTIRKRFTDIRGKLRFVEMHDLMHDLAAHVAGEEIATVSSSSGENDIYARARHLVWEKEDLSGKEFPKCLLKASKARTSAFLHPMGSLSKSFLETLLLNFKCLRVLMLCESEFEELPDLIGQLKHLRYLDVSLNSKLKKLPNAVCKLVNLQVLDFGHCNDLQKLPKEMHRLVSLRSLFVTSKATCLPKKGFKCWSSLRILKIINCRELRSLPESMGDLKSLRIFGIELCSSLASLPNDMKHITNLEKLSIGHCKKLDLAEWEGLNGLIKLNCLRLYSIPKMVNFPYGLKSVAGSLQLLMIGDCVELKSLPEELELCTSLLKLQVYGCDELSKLPVGVKNLVGLQELTIVGCEVLSKRCEREAGDDWVRISHIPYIHIDHEIIQNRAFSTQE